MVLLPAAPGTCPVCAVAHDSSQAHNAQSMHYQYRFWGLRRRWPTWADAIAHCSPEIRKFWEDALRDAGHWTEPEDGSAPIADPPAESLRELVEISIDV